MVEGNKNRKTSFSPSKALALARDIIYPSRCPGCDEVLFFTEKEKGFCGKCAGKIEYVGDNCCEICGKKLDFKAGGFCKNCKSKRHFFEQTKSLYLYSGVMKQAMYRFKYGNRRAYARVFAREIAIKYGQWITNTGVEAIVPVPMFKDKERARGYNQAMVLAEALSKEMGIPICKDLVIRTKDTLPMKELDEKTRRENLKNSFKIASFGVVLNKVLIIDDIYTTGATMDAVAKVLLDNGVESFGITVCSGSDL